MKKLLAVVVLSLCFITPSQADDIRDFQIEGVSIGDSLKDYMTIKDINMNLAKYYKDNEMSTALMVLKKSNEYENLNLSFKTSDKNYQILHISGFQSNKFKECIKKAEKINLEFKQFFKNVNAQILKNEKHPVDVSGKSIMQTYRFTFQNGDIAAVQCYNFSNEVNYPSGLKIQLMKKEFLNWLANKAYK